jgi:hypothetical protein
MKANLSLASFTLAVSFMCLVACLNCGKRGGLNDPCEITHFEDALLEKEALARGDTDGDGVLSAEEALGIVEIVVALQEQEGTVSSLEGLQCLKNLQKLFLVDGTTVTNFSPIAELHDLRELDLRGSGGLRDITFIGNLTHITGVTLFDCSISDPSPILRLNLEEMNYVLLAHNPIDCAYKHVIDRIRAEVLFNDLDEVCP